MSETNRDRTIAVIGAGEMGAAVANRMREMGARVITSTRGRSAASIERVRHARLEVVDDEDQLSRGAVFILSIVPPREAISVAERFRAAIARAPEKPAFVECNAISPASVRRVEQILDGSGCIFIDAGIIGGPPPAGRTDRGPRFYASGPHANLLARLNQYGLDISILDGPIGAASALKMSYAGLTKGMIAIGAAMIAGASRAGLGPALRDELRRSQRDLLPMLAARVPAMFPKAYRWVAEMEQIAEFLGGDPQGGGIYEGAAALYEQIASDWAERGNGSTFASTLSSFFNPAEQS